MTEAGRRSIRRATIFLFPALAILIALGTWQLQRREWKLALLADIDANLNAPPTETLDDSVHEFRRVRLSGTLRPDRTLLLRNRLREGVMGVEAVVPLELADGRTLLIDRGWRPAGPLPAAAPEPGRIEGILRRQPEVNPFSPDNRPDRGEWYRIDIPAMAASLGIAPGKIVPFYVMESPATLPQIPNDHLQYAITWYALAATLVGVYAAFVVRVRREGDGA